MEKIKSFKNKISNSFLLNSLFFPFLILSPIIFNKRESFFAFSFNFFKIYKKGTK